MDLKFNESEHLRIKLTRNQKKLIRNMYIKTYKEIKKKIEKLHLMDNVTSKVNKRMLLQLSKEIESEYQKLGSSLQNTIEDSMKQVSSKVVDKTADFATSAGLIVGNGYYNLPDEIIKRITTGKVYESSWSLSKAIWKQNNKVKIDVNRIIASGVAQNKTSYEIAKDLEKYVNPNSRKEWEWKKVYPGTNLKIDYNAQRLARTMVSHAYQQSVIITSKDNPFVKGIRWLTANSHRVCPICMDREGKIYKPEELPLDHPNGMCTFEYVIEEDMTEISNRIADWYNGKEDKELDKYAKFLQNF